MTQELTQGAEGTYHEMVAVQALYCLKVLENKANYLSENPYIADTKIPIVHATSDFRDNNVIGLWSTLNNKEISFWVEKGLSECQHWDGPFTTLKQTSKNQVWICSKNYSIPPK